MESPSPVANFDRDDIQPVDDSVVNVKEVKMMSTINEEEPLVEAVGAVRPRPRLSHKATVRFLVDIPPDDPDEVFHEEISLWVKFRANSRTFLWFTILAIGMAVVLYDGFLYYYVVRERLWRVIGFQIVISRVSAGVIKALFSVLLVTVSYRSCTTFRRALPRCVKGLFIPWEKFIVFHMSIAYMIVFLSLLHVICHVVNIGVIATVTTNELACTLERPDHDGNYALNCCDYLNIGEMETCCPVTCPREANEGYFCGSMNVSDAIDDICSLGGASQLQPEDLRDMFNQGLLSNHVMTQSDLHLQTVYGLTGWFLVLFMFIMVMTSLPFVRKKYFERFFHPHHLYIPIYILLALHGAANLINPPSFWYWALPSVLIFAWEKLYAVYIRWTPRLLRSAEIYRSTGVDALKLHFERPFGVEYAPGDWFWLQSLDLSKGEWHPVATICSPMDEHTLSFVYQVNGNWTSGLQRSLLWNLGDFALEFVESGGAAAYARLRAQTDDDEQDLADPVLLADHFCSFCLQEFPSEDALEYHQAYKKCATIDNAMSPVGSDVEDMASVGGADKSPNKDDPSRRKERKLARRFRKRTKVPNITAYFRLDGPYGSYGDECFDFDSVVMFAAGVGVTPLVSIIQTLKLQKIERGSCDIRKVRFHWVVRDATMVQWVLAELNNCISVLGKDKLEVRLYQSRGKELIETFKYLETGRGRELSLKIYSGRIPVRSIFKHVVLDEPEDTSIGVFSSGPDNFSLSVRYETEFQKTLPEPHEKGLTFSYRCL